MNIKEILGRLNPKNYVIDDEFQYSYIISSLLLLFFVTLSTFIIIIIWNKYRFYQGYLLNPPSPDIIMDWAKENRVAPDSIEFAYQFIAQARPYTFYNIVIGPVLLIFAVNALVISAVSLYISYKIAAPLSELKLALRRKVETGNFEKPLTVRKGDPFQELTSLANLAFTVAVHPGIKPFRKYDDNEKNKDK